MKFNFSSISSFQFSQVIKQITTLIISIILAKSGLSLEFIGIYESFLWIGFITTGFLISGLSESFLSKFEDSPFQYYLTTLLLSFIIFIILFNIPSKQIYWSLFVTIICLNFPTFLIDLIWLKKNNPNSLLLFSTVYSIFQIGLILVPIRFQWNSIFIFYGLLCLAVLKHIFLIIQILSNKKFNFQLLKMVNWINSSLPLIAYSFLGAMHIFLDGWIVQYFFPEDSAKFAIYRYGSKELPLSMAITASFGLAIIPSLKTNISNGLKGIKSQSLNFYHILFPISIVLMFFSDILFIQIFNPSFKDSVVIFQIYLLLLIPRTIINKPILIAKEDNAFILKVAINEVLINIITSITLGYYFGLWGIATGTLIAYYFEKIAFGLRLKIKYGINFSGYSYPRIFFFYSFLLGLIFFIKLYQNF